MIPLYNFTCLNFFYFIIPYFIVLIDYKGKNMLSVITPATPADIVHLAMVFQEILFLYFYDIILKQIIIKEF